MLYTYPIPVGKVAEGEHLAFLSAVTFFADMKQGL